MQGGHFVLHGLAADAEVPSSFSIREANVVRRSLCRVSRAKPDRSPFGSSPAGRPSAIVGPDRQAVERLSIGTSIGCLTGCDCRSNLPASGVATAATVR